MEVLAIILLIVLIGVVGGGLYAVREGAQGLMPGAVRQRIAESEAEARERANAMREIYDDYRDQLKAMQAKQLDLERTLAEVTASARHAERERDQLFARIRQAGQQLDDQLDALRERESAALAASKPTPQLAAMTGEGGSTISSRRTQILGELYERLAKVEFSIVSLTNPVLLPGESFTVPDELAPELLQWDNWREVGESSFSLGEYFNQHRIQLDQTTARAMEAGIATVRTTLTEDIYPALTEESGSARNDAIRAALTELTIVPRLRRYLESQYRTLAGIADPDHKEDAPIAE